MPGTQNARVVIYADESRLSCALENLLSQFYQVTVVESEEDAYERLRSRQSELILLYLDQLVLRLLHIADKQAQLSGPGIIVLTKPELEQVAAQKVPSLCVLPNDIDNDVLFSVTRHELYQFRRQMKMRSNVETLQSEIQDLKLVQRAKLLLIQNLNMDENQAHRYIEKSAMNGCIKRRDVARTIISTYEN